MRNFIFLPFIFLFASSLLSAKPVLLTEAMEKGWVKLTAIGTGGHQNQAIKLSLVNTAKRYMDLLVPAGFLFYASDSSYQDLIVVRERLVNLEKDARKSALLYTLCIRSNRASPVASLAFLSGGMATGALAKMAQHIHEKGLHESPAAQSAMWAVSNNHLLEGIGDQELAKFTAQLLGKPEPTYHIQYAENGQPGQQAFRNEPIAVSGNFKYENKKDITATFALYNQEGERVFTFFENEVRKPGQHNFRFNFRTNRLPRGTYQARLTDAAGQFIAGVPIEL